jgi:hypothetical protein
LRLTTETDYMEATRSTRHAEIIPGYATLSEWQDPVGEPGAIRASDDRDRRTGSSGSSDAKHGYQEVPRYSDDPLAEHWFEKKL